MLDGDNVESGRERGRGGKKWRKEETKSRILYIHNTH